MSQTIVKKNKRNITGGEIHLNHVDQADKIDEDATQDYDDSLLSVLDMEPEITKIFIENLKDGEFIEINQNALRRRIQMMEEQNKKTAQSEDVLLVLNQLIHDVIKLVDRFIFFFQGLVSGMAIMHLVIIYLDSDLISTFKYYSKTALRIDQVFHIMLMISCFGSLFVAMQLQDQANKTKRSVDRKLYIQSILTSICYSISYLAWIIAHQGISQATSSLPLAIDTTAATDQIYVKYDANYSDLEQWIGIWKVLQIVITGFTIFGWCISVTTTESNLDFIAQVQAEEAENIVKQI